VQSGREGFPAARHTNLPMNQADRELVDRLLRADARAFELFFNEYFPKLYRFVKRRAPNDAAAAEDIAQSTLCRALQSLRGYRGEAALFTWLCTLCRREMSQRWRDRDASTGVMLAEDDPEVRAALESLVANEVPIRSRPRIGLNCGMPSALRWTIYRPRMGTSSNGNTCAT
jgi:hypothetical protein